MWTESAFRSNSLLNESPAGVFVTVLSLGWGPLAVLFSKPDFKN